MSIITFWNNGNEETGKTSAITAIATHMSIEHNYRILVISTSYEDTTLGRCFWKEKKIKKNLGLFGPNTSVGMEEGIDGIAKVIKSNKMPPENIKNYTKTVFKDTFEILEGTKGSAETHRNLSSIYPDVIKLANSYYDLVLVDLDSRLGEECIEKILKSSNLIIATLSQRLSSIDNFMELRQKKPMLKSKNTLILIGRYDKFSKYTSKNISRYMREKNEVITIPYNTLFFEACEEAGVPDLFLRLRKIDKEDRNAIFIEEVARAADNIIYRLQDIATKM